VLCQGLCRPTSYYGVSQQYDSRREKREQRTVEYAATNRALNAAVVAED
jgi:hypothetical protein